MIVAHDDERASLHALLKYQCHELQRIYKCQIARMVDLRAHKLKVLCSMLEKIDTIFFYYADSQVTTQRFRHWYKQLGEDRGNQSQCAFGNMLAENRALFGGGGGGYLRFISSWDSQQSCAQWSPDNKGGWRRS